MMSETTTGFVKMTKCGKHGKLKNSFPHLPHFFENFQMKTYLKISNILTKFIIFFINILKN